MDIKVLPYIDHEKLQKQQASETDPASSADGTGHTAGVSAAAGDSVSAGDGDFQAALQTAERTLEALTIDLIASRDAESIRRAAEVLSQSGNTRLRQLARDLINTEAGTGTPVPDDTGASGSVQGIPVTSWSASGDDSSNSAVPAGTAEDTSATAQAGSTESPSAAADTSAGTASSSAAADTTANTKGTASSRNTYTGSADTETAAQKASSALDCPSSLEPYFIEASEKYNIDVALLEAVAKTESNFNTSDVSSAGAVGVMQLMPSTARSLGVTDSYDAHANILGGAKLLSSNLKTYKGDLSLALAAYNAGPGNVKKYGGIPPFTETQNYVKRVTKFYKEAKA